MQLAWYAEVTCQKEILIFLGRKDKEFQWLLKKSRACRLRMIYLPGNYRGSIFRIVMWMAGFYLPQSQAGNPWAVLPKQLRFLLCYKETTLEQVFHAVILFVIYRN